MRSLRVQSDRDEIIERIGRLKGDEKALWGKMNVNQMVSHLVQSGDLPFDASLPDKSGFVSRTLIKPLVLYVLPMPKDVKTSAQMNQQENGRRPTEFNADKALAIESVMRLGSLPLEHDCSYHPFFGKMSSREWGILGYKHIDHHLKQFGV
jgi:hypothetical protein